MKENVPVAQEATTRKGAGSEQPEKEGGEQTSETRRPQIEAGLPRLSRRKRAVESYRSQ